jgi:hypothetical protein
VVFGCSSRVCRFGLCVSDVRHALEVLGTIDDVGTVWLNQYWSYFLFRLKLSVIEIMFDC